ncbi:MAG TPA: peptidylprolyl isomerase [Mycobacteriales bacterium]
MPSNRQRREAAERHLRRQLQRRQEAAAKRRRRAAIGGSVAAVVVVVVVVLLLTTGVFGGGSSKKAVAVPSKPTATATASAKPTATPSPFATRTFAKATRAVRKTSGPCGYAETTQSLKSPYTKDVGLPPDPRPTPDSGTVAVSLSTSDGPMTLSLDRAKAPCAVQSFLYLVKKGLYDGSTCPRVTTTGIYVLQCGDPSNSQQGGPTYDFKQETTKTTDYSPGVVAMANTGQPNSTGSQFFIIYKNSNTGLQKSYSVVGTVSKGLAAVTKVAKAGAAGGQSAGDGKPVLGMTITTATTAG